MGQYLTRAFFFKGNANVTYSKEVVLKTIKSYTLKRPKHENFGSDEDDEYVLNILNACSS
jgi:hypothetical protein